MSTTHNYSQWTTTDVRGRDVKPPSVGSMGRRSADGSMAYTVDNINPFSGHLPSGSAGIRPTSSLAGAMGESAVSGVRSSQPPALGWDGTQAPQSTEYYSSGNHSYSPSATGGYLYRSPSSRNDSPESLPSVSSSGSQRHFMDISNPASPYHHSVSEEVLYLREKVRQLENECQRAKTVIDRLPHSPNFQIGWDARTEARKKIFCSLNRAGNALCAWHDSRRERRAFPARNAPPGLLNCGCSYEEALFEESLSRHGVGSYHPGDVVRMDPALRRPLLRLLKQRYNYRDGDFDLDPITETWAKGESPEDWQRKTREGKAMKTKS